MQCSADLQSVGTRVLRVSTKDVLTDPTECYDSTDNAAAVPRRAEQEANPLKVKAKQTYALTAQAQEKYTDQPTRIQQQLPQPRLAENARAAWLERWSVGAYFEQLHRTRQTYPPSSHKPPPAPVPVPETAVSFTPIAHPETPRSTTTQ